MDKVWLLYTPQELIGIFTEKSKAEKAKEDLGNNPSALMLKEYTVNEVRTQLTKIEEVTRY